MTRIVTRPVSEKLVWSLEQSGLHPLLARIYAARGVAAKGDLDYGLAGLLPPKALKGAEDAAALLADALEAEARILIVADYDCDGATACAVAVRGLRSLGGTVDYLVPNRFTLGYGLSPEIVDLAAERNPDLLVTVDNGIASIAGVERARELGIATLITDHHLPGETLPEAEVIVNPNQPDCAFPSKNLAGVGVMFYVLLALRAELRNRGFFTDRPEPNFGNLLDLVALGTVADVVKLDRNNRILVAQGLARMRQGKLCAGIRALFSAAGRELNRLSAFDLGFVVGPRLNAAGRLSDMSLGIECLITDDPGRALNIAQELDKLNRERREIEAGMQEQALERLAELEAGGLEGEGNAIPAALALFDADWHQGVVGILASRIKDRIHRPVFAFARGENGEIKGSGRSIPGFHLRDALDLVSKRAPSLLVKFGGHAMAAGATIPEERFDEFRDQFARVADEWLTEAELTRTLETDGGLDSGFFNLDVARLLEGEVWGQGFPPPLFQDEFVVEQRRVLKEKHLKLTLRKGNTRLEAIRFNSTDDAGDHIRAAYRLTVNEYNGISSPQLVIEYAEGA
ncbi:single-stranded-DNA-specific exonuclease RecJ [Oryzomicrobium sp.]|uniref:single-stranded-DNA-specific exonuclease RecJ n=1 Tax=Oryzomicrobium sp. TaxID=1911578 RepID=UPI0025F16F27|nr:single-stranded-DNA-specific exonuclease RecJ [Oryzomicrobium sp.]MCE1242708.1 single-stranded-DNA-specific exonuclease RecJ [Oryzomicrobium sp.]